MEWIAKLGADEGDGIDDIELLISIEERFGIRIPDHEMETFFSRRKSGDYPMRELYDFVCTYTPTCQKCAYDLRGHVSAGQCPECGKTFDLRVHANDGKWPALREVVASCLGIPTERVSLDSFIYEDLYLSQFRK